ncbi:hypothetical protein [Intestinibacter sp.]|uniref:hypothetical protein n=1 Tax=Intestinibacter sp. TaxID=1965304 RepID=UPI00307CCF0F
MSIIEESKLSGINLGRWSKETTKLKYEYKNEYDNEVKCYKMSKKQLEEHLKGIDIREVNKRR